MADDLNYLQTRAREWAAKVVNLYHMKVPPEFEPGKKALLTTAKKIKDAVETITGPLDYLKPMNELGILPLVIGAIGVSGAIALIVKWTLDYNTFLSKVNERNKLIAAGMDPVQAAKVANMADRTESPLFGIDFSKLAFPALVTVVGFLYGKKQGWF